MSENMWKLRTGVYSLLRPTKPLALKQLSVTENLRQDKKFENK